MERRKQERHGRARRATAAGRIALGLILVGLLPVPALTLGPSPFAFLFDARTALHDLWLESVAAQEERVACIGGHFDGDIFHVTHARRVDTPQADSLRSSAGPSLDACGPPLWLGTAHTHIALYRGYPYATFSMSDRAVMGLWRTRWKMEGVFCVLFSENQAYCEYGASVSGDSPYGQQRGNIIFP